MTNTPNQISFHDGHSIPQLGLGVWQASNEQAALAVREALLNGYRNIDTAAIYGNEEGVAAGIKQSGVPRKDVFVTTKIWNDAQGASQSRAAFMQSLERLDTDYVDLLLIHWPLPMKDKYIETWRTMIELQQEGLVKSIGVSNFMELHLKRLIQETAIKPVLNQIELHPYMQQNVLRDAHQQLGIRTEAWSPLAQNKALNDAVIGQIAQKHGKTPTQIVIRWHLDNQVIVIPKSVTPSRIKQNFDVFDFELDHDDMTLIAALEKGQRLGPDPEVFSMGA